MMGRRGAWVGRVGVAFSVAAVLGACNGPPTPQDRGFVKPPLTVPGLVIESEQETEMSRLGRPIRPQVVEIPAPAAAPAGGS